MTDRVAGQETLGFTGTTSRLSVEDLKTPLIPKWASALIEQVCTDEGVEIARPRVEWVALTHTRWTQDEPQPDLWGGVSASNYTKTRGLNESSAGSTWSGIGKIRIRAGSDPNDLRMVLLHELAHWLLPAGERHGIRFWRKAWELYFRYTAERAEIERIRVRERNYKRLADIVFLQMDNSLWTVRTQPK